MPDRGVHLHREQAPADVPPSIAACREIVVVRLDATDASALRRLLAGHPEVRMVRIARRQGDACVRAEVECLAGTAQALMAQLAAASERGAIGALSSYARRGGTA